MTRAVLRRYPRRTFIALSILATLATGAAPTTELEPPVGIRELVGERLEYRVLWAGVPVGSASMSVGIGPKPWVLEMRSTADSYPALRWIYPVEDRVLSRVVSDTFRAKEYRKLSREGFRSRERRQVLFDPANGSAGTLIDGERIPYLQVPEDILDPLSAIYAYRVHPAPGGEPPELPITDGRSLVTARMNILGTGRVSVPAGTFETVEVEPQIEGLGGIFRRSPDATIRLWITRDRWRRLVRMETKVAIGSVRVELTRITEPTGAPRPSVLAQDWERWRPDEPDW